MGKRLGFAIIGCGRISGKHVEGIANNNDEARLVAVNDIVAERMDEAVSNYQKFLPNAEEVKQYADYKELLKDASIDVVNIATESGYHPQIVLDALDAGKHVIVEKPMALSTDDADKMIAKAKEKNLKLCVCHQNRFNAPIQKLREAVEGNKFGKMVYGVASIRWNRNMGYYQQAPWRGTWELDGGTLMNQCIHNIDLLQWMMGDVDHVYAQTDTFLRDIEGEDTGVAVLRFKNGALGIIEGTACVFPKNLEETLNIFGETGTACIGGLAVNKIETWRFADDSMENEVELLKQQQDDPDTVYGFGHIPLIKDMIDAIHNDREPLINGEEGKKALEIILAIYKSARTKAPVDFPIGNYSTLTGVK
jgi:UDP-N-acetyl-2-amino-2-deoxyglucuronate dehydrogenase